MALLCFLLDLRTLPPTLLRDLTESLLQLANLYAISSLSSRSDLDRLEDRIGLCYVFKSGASSTDDELLEIAYSPRESFSLRDFHRAVENVPTDAFVPELNDSETLCCRDAKLSAILTDQLLYSWGGKNGRRKVIVLSTSASYDLDSDMQKKLEAADVRVSVEFVMFERKSNHLSGIEEKESGLMRSISDIENCSLRSYIPDVRVFQSLIRRWLHDLKDDMQEPVLACFGFKSNLIHSINQITCKLYMPVNQIIDSFSPCQTCRCHGRPLEDHGRKMIKEPSCAITGHCLENSDVITNSMKIGGKTILFLPSYQCLTKLQQSCPPISFDIIERTNLGTLCESVIIGASYVVVPSSSVGTDQCELNTLAFHGLCGILHSMDQGLVCLSYWNMETMKETTFPCYYILQPSCNGLMLLKRLAGSEEILYVPDIKTLITSPVNEDIQRSIKDSLEKVEVKDYNPLMHERGLHKKLNFLVKESLEFGSLIPKAKETSGPDSMRGILDPVNDAETVIDNTEMCVAESWEQLVTLDQFPEIRPSVQVSEAKSLPDGSKQLAVKTSRILERLELPRERKKAISPNTQCLSSNLAEINFPTTQPPTRSVQIHAPLQGLSSSQLMKPNFNKLKRKRT